MSRNGKPVIGVSANVSPPDDPKRTFSKGVTLYNIQEHYTRFIEAGGGIPLTVTPFADLGDIPPLLERMDGLLITGGVDLDPSLYGEQNTHSKGCDISVDRFEIALIDEARRRGLPLLCICRGIQLLNVAAGGSLFQDILERFPDALHHHRWEDGKESFHDTELTPGTVLSRMMGKTSINTNSSHHQAVDRPGEGFSIAATAPDGIVEAIVNPDEPQVLGVQWHPERMLDDPLQLRLARWLVSQSAGSAAE